MSNIIVKDRNGNIEKISANSGMTLMEIIRDAGMDIEAACGGCCACATCHIYVDSKWLPNLKEKEEDEESMLDQVFDVKENSRLGCQIEFTEEISGIEVELASE